MLIPTGVRGLYGRGAMLERLVVAVSTWVARAGAAESAEIMRFPPLMARDQFERSGYFRHFADLVGTVHCFDGDEEAHRTLLRAHDAGKDWTGAQAASDLVLAPAACYPVYPTLARRGSLPADGTVVDACSYCFRREPSDDPGRMQAFRMHERVFVGTAEGAREFRERWIGRATVLAAALELGGEVAVANDPFFGRIGRIMVRGQRDKRLKLELLLPVTAGRGAAACASFNLHGGKMAEAFGLELRDGSAAHTACVGFGLERLALAILQRHGEDEAGWPHALRTLVAEAGPAGTGGLPPP